MIGKACLRGAMQFEQIENRISELYKKIERLDLDTRYGLMEKEELERLISINADFYRYFNQDYSGGELQ